VPDNFPSSSLVTLSPLLLEGLTEVMLADSNAVYVIYEYTPLFYDLISTAYIQKEA
jgi:hypothetical protein